jgi:glyceraldehyde 3-phosphate dehydrogenase
MSMGHSPARIGIMGLGRIGRNLFRLLYGREDVVVAGISELAAPEGLEYLLRFDTLLGKFPDELSIRGGNLYVLGRQIPVIIGKPADQAPWGDLGVETVLEATSKRRSRRELEAHLEAGAKRVIACAPPREPPDATAVFGVNERELKASHRIVSNASSTVHCVAPVARILHDAFGIERAQLTTIHSYTSQHRLADVPAENMRGGRAAAENIIPQESRSPAILMEVLPELAGKLSGFSMTVPVPNGSAVDLVCWHAKKVDRVAINEVIRTAAASDRWKRVLQYEDDPIVSSDVALSSYSSVFDSLSTMVLGERVSKTLSWYDAGYGFAHRAIDLVTHFAALDRPKAA